MARAKQTARRPQQSSTAAATTNQPSWQIPKNAAPSNMIGDRSFTRADLLAEIAESPKFKIDFAAVSDSKVVTLGHGAALPPVFIGHANLSKGPDPEPDHRIWAHFTKSAPGSCSLGNDLDLKLSFCLTNGRRFILESFANIRLATPFAGLNSSTLSQFRTVVLYYLSEKGYLEDVIFHYNFPRHFQEACGQIARNSRNASRFVPWPTSVSSTAAQSTTHPDTIASITSENKTNGVATGSSSEPSRRSAESTKDRESVTAPNKRQREDDDFAEYQNLVRRIRQGSDADNDTLKAENERLRTYANQLKTDKGGADQELKVKRAKVVTLENEILKLRVKIKELEEVLDKAETANVKKVKELEKEVEELQSFKQKVKGLF